MSAPRWARVVTAAVLVALVLVTGGAAAQGLFSASRAYDLAADERLGGHTLDRHVGRSDGELRERLRRQPGISAASTYSDRETAERVVAAVIGRERSRIDRWLRRSGSRPNLALDYRGSPSDPIGRTVRRGDNRVLPCWDAVVVLRWDSGRRYYVLTSYPERRP